MSCNDPVGKTPVEKGRNVLRPYGMMVLYGGSSGAAVPIDRLVLTQNRSLNLTPG
jgi:NADPH:quinone reductase